MKPSILIAGIGNIFLGDDAFGVEAVRALAGTKLPDEVAIVDFGIRGFDLAYALLDQWDTVILVDALSRGDAPGTLYTLEPDMKLLQDPQSAQTILNPHGMDPVSVLRLASSMGEVAANIYVVGCEPEDFGDELEGRMGLSETVQSSIAEVVEMISRMIERILATKGMCPV
jgi:hydrogenase maturation protease